MRTGSLSRAVGAKFHRPNTTLIKLLSSWIVEFLTDLSQDATHLRAKGLISKSALHGSGSFSTHKPFIAIAPTLTNLFFSSWLWFYFCLFLFKSQNKICIFVQFCTVEFLSVWQKLCILSRRSLWFLGQEKPPLMKHSPIPSSKGKGFGVQVTFRPLNTTQEKIHRQRLKN